MKKRTIIIGVICLLVVVAGASLYLYRTELKDAATKIGILKGGTEGKQVAGSQQGGGASKAATKTEPANQAEETPTVEIPTDKQQLIGVRTVLAAIRPLNRVIRTVGRIEYDERKLATANTKIEGWIEKLHVDYTGRYVKKGEPLSQSFAEHTKLYPILMSDMLAVGEETGKVAEMLKQIAEFYEEDVAQKTKDLSTIIEPVLMIVIGVAVGIFAVAVIQPIYSLSSAI